MLTDEHRDSFVAMLIEQRQHVAMPECKDDRILRAPQRDDTRVVHNTYPPAPAEHSHERHAKARRPAPLAVAIVIGVTGVCHCARRSTDRSPQLAALRRCAVASSRALAGTRRAAPGVPSDSRTRSSSTTIRARHALWRSRSGSSASATAFGASAACTN